MKQRVLILGYGKMGHAMEYEIANVVDPHFTVAAKMRKSRWVARPSAAGCARR